MDGETKADKDPDAGAPGLAPIGGLGLDLDPEEETAKVEVEKEQLDDEDEVGCFKPFKRGEKLPTIDAMRQMNRKKAAPSGPRKMLVVYDFDQTITVTHVYHHISGAGKEALDKLPDKEVTGLFGGEGRIANLKTHFQSLKDRGGLLRICSFGFVDVIKSCLDRVGLGDFFPRSTIYGADHAKMKEFRSQKFMLIEYLMKQESIASKSDCYFIDDDKRNIILAQER